MIRSKPHISTDPGVDVVVHPRTALVARLPELAEFVRASAPTVPLSKHPAWLNVLQAAMGHEVFAVEAVADGRTHGFLPLAHVSSMLFGRFLVSLPYLNTNGVVASSPDVQTKLVARAVALADELNVRYLELRHERPVVHHDLHDSITSKVHMRLPLPHTAHELWKGFDPKVRNQVRKGEKQHFRVSWGGHELVDGFYDVLCHNMRDLGTPVFGKRLFHEILAAFPNESEVCLVRDDARPVAAALLVHGWGITEVPTAAARKEYNPTCANMMMYWRLLERAVGRGQRVFDFGRSTTDGNTFKYKKQWGAVPHPAVWQYCARDGGVGDLRPDNPRFRLAIRAWQNLPVCVARLIGPPIVRGIP
jgi:FemAB-related protein (PEP-CTERM system-associated)